jgi:hypothetical protein
VPLDPVVSGEEMAEAIRARACPGGFHDELVRSTASAPPVRRDRERAAGRVRRATVSALPVGRDDRERAAGRGLGRPRARRWPGARSTASAPLAGGQVDRERAEWPGAPG